MAIIIVVGPQGCGKTKNAEKLCEVLNCSAFVDDCGRIDQSLLKAKVMTTEQFTRQPFAGLVDNPHFGKDILVLSNHDFTLTCDNRHVKAVYNYHAIQGLL